MFGDADGSYKTSIQKDQPSSKAEDHNHIHSLPPVRLGFMLVNWSSHIFQVWSWKPEAEARFEGQ